MEDNTSFLRNWLQEGKQLLSQVRELPEDIRKEFLELFHSFLQKAGHSSPRLYLIVNEGVHPILSALKRQYGENIRYEVITRGNADLSDEAAAAQRVKEIVKANPEAEFVIVPSGLPYLITVVYNTVYQITSKHPVYLQLDRENGRYVEKILDPRKLMI